MIRPRCPDCLGKAAEHESGRNCAADMAALRSDADVLADIERERDANAKDRADDLATETYMDDQRGLNR